MTAPRPLHHPVLADALGSRRGRGGNPDLRFHRVPAFARAAADWAGHIGLGLGVFGLLWLLTASIGMGPPA